MSSNGRNVIKFGVPPNVSWDEIEKMFHRPFYNQIRLVPSQYLFIKEREMEAHLEELGHLANIVSTCKTGKPQASTFESVGDAAAFFQEHCYYPSIGELRKNKDKEAECYKGSSDSILSYLKKLPLKKDTMPPPCEPDFVHICGGQALTIAENIYTLREVLKRYVGPKTCSITCGGHVYHSYPKTVDQFNIAVEVMDQDCDGRGPDTHLPPKYPFALLKRAMGGTGAIRIVAFNKPEKEMGNLLERVSLECPDKPLVGIVISTQPEQLAVVADKVFGRTAHTVHMAYMQNPNAMLLKAKYWGESVEVTAMFGLLDLAKVLHEQSK